MRRCTCLCVGILPVRREVYLNADCHADVGYALALRTIRSVFGPSGACRASRSLIAASAALFGASRQR